MIDLKLLGPLVLVAGGRPVTLGPQQRILLLVLILAEGRRVPSGRLAALMWPGSESERIPATLRSHIAHLRRALDGSSGGARPKDSGSVLVTERLADGAAYSLRIDPNWLDIARFERLIADGRDHMADNRWHGATMSYGRALSLWRGRPFADVADRSFAAAEVRRLEALHRAALSGRAEADVHLQRHREVTGELQAMVARWPDDEALRELLVICLARTARTAEAARVCRDGILLALSQGLDPAPMERLLAGLLRSSPHLAIMRRTPPMGVRG
jgi:DNA-binding SARP family transcriptional activator